MPTDVYYQDAFTICVQQAPILPRWMNVFLIITDRELYVAGILLYFVVAILVFLLTTFEPKPLDAWKSFFLTFQTLYSVTSFRPKRTVFRILFFSALYTQLIYATMLNAYLIAFVTRQISGWQISTFQDLIESNYDIFASEMATQYVKAYEMVSVRFSLHLEFLVHDQNWNL